MKHLLGVAATCLVVAAAILLLSLTPYFSHFNSSAYDFTLRLAGEISPVSPTSIVAIDEESLQKDGAWPWTRDKLAQLIDRIQSGGPKVIAVDILLDDKKTDEGDDALAAAISRTPSIVLAERLSDDSGHLQWRKPNEKFIQPQVRLGHVHADPDLDNMVRRIYSAKVQDGAAVEAFSIQALRASGYPVEGDFAVQTNGATVLRPQTIAIRFAGESRQTFPQIPAWQVLDGSVAPKVFKDRIVLIGSTAAALQDEGYTPFSVADGQKMSGVEIHANAIETLFTHRYIRDVSDAVLFLLLALTAFLLWWIDRRFEGLRFYMAALSMIPGTVFISWLLLKFWNVWLPFPPFMAATVLVAPGLEVIELIRVNRDLDRKIERLSGSGAAFHRRGKERGSRDRILAGMTGGADRDRWLAALDAAESELETRGTYRQRLLETTHRNARWRLHAVDFFNDDLVQFLSFNNAILASIDDVIIVADPAGRIVFQNPAAKRLTGYAEDPPFAPDYLASLLDGRSFLEVFGHAVGSTEATIMPFIQAQDGQRFYTVTLAAARFGVVISMNDTTAQQELNQAKNDMVSLVSHELRTPLTSIRGYSDMLLKYDLVGEKGKPFLSTIINESNRLNQLIQSFLDIGEIESGRKKIQKTEFETGPVLNDMLDVISPVAAEKQIRIETPETVSSIRVHADRLLLYQALSNLMVNAIKYSPAGTTIQLSVANGGGKVKFGVTDEGCGIPADETAKIFEKFYRRGNRETREQSGFGLGLAFVKEIAIRHGGDVVVDSQVGKGSTFTLWIPN